MAQDDYFVIAYKILMYLYYCVKNGEKLDINFVTTKTKVDYINIDYKYWCYIMENMLNAGYVEGIKIKPLWGELMEVKKIDKIQITPDSIAYLLYDKMMKKAKEYLEDNNVCIPKI